MDDQPTQSDPSPASDPGSELAAGIDAAAAHDSRGPNEPAAAEANEPAPAEAANHAPADAPAGTSPDTPAEAPADVPAEPWSEGVCRALIVGFAGWTVLCHLTVAAGGNLYDLLWATAAASACALAAALWWRARRRVPPVESRPMPLELLSADAPGTAEVARGAAFWGKVLAFTVAAVAVMVAYRATDNIYWLWWGSLAVLAAALAVDGWHAAPTRAPHVSPRWNVGLWQLSIAGAALVLLLHRFDSDDVFTVNLAVAIADAPEQSLLAYDTLHGLPDRPLTPYYRLPSFEVLGGAISYLTGLPAIYVFHFLLAGIAGFLVAPAYASLMRRLLPGEWIWGVAILCLLLLTAGDTHSSHGNYAFVRLFQGKCIYVTVVTPLLISYAWQMADAPCWRHGLLLAAAQIAAVGLTSSALWAAPLTVALTLLARLRPGRQGLVALAGGLATSAYVVAAGLVVRQQLGATVADHRRIAEQVDVQAVATYVWHMVLGDYNLWAAVLVAMLAGWTLLPYRATRRWAIVLSLGWLLLLFNPYLLPTLATHVTGLSTYWRVFWILRAPTLLVFVLASPLWLVPRERVSRTEQLLLTAAVSAAFIFVVPTVMPISFENNTRLASPGLKVPPQYAVAAGIVHHVPPGAAVLAPSSVAAWLTTFHHHPQPLVTRRLYLTSLREHLADEEVDRRAALELYVAGDAIGDEQRELLADSIRRDQLAAVCLRAVEWLAGAREVLRDSGFELVDERLGYEIWLRRQPAREAAVPAAGLY